MTAAAAKGKIETKGFAHLIAEQEYPSGRVAAPHESRLMPSFRPNQLLKQFIQLESISSIVLAASTIIALTLANSSFSAAYFHFLEIKIIGLSFQQCINDGLMVIFFFVVGLEVKREIVSGSLSSLRKAALPVSGAIGGMLAPAIIYYLFNSTGPIARGWAIPTATDIAFAIGVLTLLGRRIPISLKIFLLTLAVADDIGAIFIIATFYSKEIHVLGLFIAALAIVAILGAQRFKINSYFFYIPFGFILWVGVLYSGVHATIAGVVLGFLTPHKFFRDQLSQSEESPIDYLIHILHPWVSFGVMPIFALANAGVSMIGVHLTTLLESSISQGVFFGLILGKPLGVVSASLLTVFLGLASKPLDLKWKHLVGASFLAGIGFTMAIFITNLSLSPENQPNAKLAILLGSSFSAICGYFILRTFPLNVRDE